MNPLTNIKNIQKLNERELELGIIGKKSWHDEYKDSAWVYIGGLPFDLTEGDVICVFSQYGEVVNLNLIRDQKTGKFKGFGFLCYEDQRSTVLSVDNLNGIKILGRTIRVDHVKDYKMPKEHGDEDDATLKIRNEGCAPQLESSSEAEMKTETSDEENVTKAAKKEKKSKKEKKKKKKKKKQKKHSSSSMSDSDDDIRESPHLVEVKQERNDEGYSKALKKENMYRSDSSDSRHGSRDKTYRNGRDKYKYGGSNASSRDRNDSSRDRNDNSRDRNDSSRDRNDSSRDRNVSSRDRNVSSRDRNDSSRDWNERTDRKDSGRDRNNRRTDTNNINRSREDSSRDRDANYSRDRYTNNGFHSQEDFSNRFDSSSANRGRGRAYGDHGARGRYGDGRGGRHWSHVRGRGRGGRGVRGNFRGQNEFFDGHRDRSRESRYY